MYMQESREKLKNSCILLLKFIKSSIYNIVGNIFFFYKTLVENNLLFCTFREREELGRDVKISHKVMASTSHSRYSTCCAHNMARLE